MPRPTRGMSNTMLVREFKSPQAITELAKAGLIKGRDWYATAHKVPTPIWIPTKEGEELCARLDETEPGAAEGSGELPSRAELPDH